MWVGEAETHITINSNPSGAIHNPEKLGIPNFSLRCKGFEPIAGIPTFRTCT